MNDKSCVHDFDSHIKWYKEYDHPSCIILVCRKCGWTENAKLPSW